MAKKKSVKRAVGDRVPLEDLVGKDLFSGIKGKRFSIYPSHKYNKGEFMERAGDLFYAEECYKRLRENLGDVEAVDGFAGLASDFMQGKKDNNYDRLREKPDLALRQAEVLWDTGSLNMAKYIGNNISPVLDKLPAENLYSLFTRVPLYRTGKMEWDRIAELRDKNIQIERAREKGSSIAPVVKEELQDLLKVAPEEQEIFIRKNRSVVIPHLIQDIGETIQEAFYTLFRDNQGNLVKKDLRQFMGKNYKTGESFIRSLPKDERESYWNDNMRPQYVEVARELYDANSVKKKNTGSRGAKGRRIKAQKIGLSA